MTRAPAPIAAEPPVEVQVAPPREASPEPRGAAAPAGPSRARFAAGLALGVVVGFLPAHIYASMAEDRLDEMRGELLHEPPPPTDAAFDLLVERYAATRARMERTKARIEIATGLIWLVAGAGVSYAFWRLSPRFPSARS